MNAIDRLVRSNTYKNIMAKLYGWGAAVVIFGALFKILHLPGANIMLIIGMGTEVAIFFFSAFEPLHVEYNWALVYPELAIADENAEPTRKERKKEVKGATPTQQLDKMLEEAKIGPELIESLAVGMKNLGDNAKKLAGVSDAAVATDAFVGNMTKAAESVRNLSLKYDTNHWYFWGVYALGFVNRNYERYDNGEISLVTYQPHFDRRHNVNLILTYTAGDFREWEFSGRWNFGTGFPFTKVQGFYEFLSFQDGIYFDYTTTNGDMGVIFGELNQGRLPMYHRFDVDVKRKFFFNEHTILEVDLGVTNVYNRANVFYVDLITYETVHQLPVLPSLGLTLSF